MVLFFCHFDFYPWPVYGTPCTLKIQKQCPLKFRGLCKCGILEYFRAVMSSDCALCHVYNFEQTVAAAVACSGGCGVAVYCGEPCRSEHWALGHGAKCGLQGWMDRRDQVGVIL